MEQPRWCRMVRIEVGDGGRRTNRRGGIQHHPSRHSFADSCSESNRGGAAIHRNDPAAPSACARAWRRRWGHSLGHAVGNIMRGLAPSRVRHQTARGGQRAERPSISRPQHRNALARSNFAAAARATALVHVLGTSGRDAASEFWAPDNQPRRPSGSGSAEPTAAPEPGNSPAEGVASSLAPIDAASGRKRTDARDDDATRFFLCWPHSPFCQMIMGRGCGVLDNAPCRWPQTNHHALGW